ncbi:MULTISPECIES: hypothetical protein [Bizionia]|uniref:Uncharacterized protein n=1 Tax=Bizionia algoritergicola TaxID=291187 RepID=A0A5D0QWP8_9FLAO|nr:MULTISPECIES: hypothetical protein [Bizionia]OBX22212.1 hypothetical protein BAA08_09725 [Bizionia sp. APA-3]TYB73215.1 hypothetical protein ES675_06005 [Bizionia algoritergicola]
MHKELLIKAFEKARNELIKQGIQNPSAVKIAEELSWYIQEKEGFSLGERTFRDYYTNALKNETEDIEVKQIKVINGLCHYLGFDHYIDFINEQLPKVKSNHSVNSKSFFQKHKIVIILLLAVTTTFIIYNSVTKQKWMLWETDHYVAADFNAKLLKEGILKLYDQDRIENFRKVNPDCQTKFFKEDGIENLWYGKNQDGTLEFFTSLGLHPGTGKTLKKITKHMINKYICDTYKSD